MATIKDLESGSRYGGSKTYSLPTTIVILVMLVFSRLR
jgi:hypothetical protein